MRFYPFFITFDAESLLDKTVEIGRFTQEHTAISISVCSNVSHFKEPFCIVEPHDQDSLVQQFVDFLRQIQAAACEEMNAKFADVIEEIELAIRDQDEDEDLNDDADGGSDEEDENKRKPSYRQCSELRRLYDRLKNYLSVIPVISFNGGFYDINLIKPQLLLSAKADST